MPNTAPSLSDLASSVIYDENIVNASAQILDADVTFIDPDDNFDAGKLTVTGLLAEDLITVVSDGFDPGQVGVINEFVYFGGTLIGDISTSGFTFTVTFNADATSAAVEAVIERLGYQNTSNTPTGSHMLTINVTDGAGDSLISAGEGITIEITEQPEDPVIDLGGATLAYTENDSATAIAPAATLVDDAAIYAGGNLTVSFPSTIDYDDHLTILATGDGPGEINVVANSVLYGGTEIGTFSGGYNGLSPLTIAFDEDATQEAVEAVLRAIAFSNASDWAYTDPRTIEFVLVDGAGATSNIGSATVTFASVNDAPVLDLDFASVGVDAQATYYSGDPATVLAPMAILEDDNEGWDGATLTIAVAGGTADDELSILAVGDDLGELNTDASNNLYYEGVLVGSFVGGADGTPLVISFNADACTCSVELAAASIQYAHDGAITSHETRTIDFTLVDGAGGDDTGSASVTLDLRSAPLVVGGGPISGDEDTPFALTGIVLTDVVPDPATDLVTLVLDVNTGTLTIRTDVVGGITAAQITAGANGTEHLVVTGTEDQINATLSAANGLTYLGALNDDSFDQLSIGAAPAVPADVIDFDNAISLPLGFPVVSLALSDLDGDVIPDLVLGGEAAILVAIGGVPTGGGFDHGLVTDFSFGDFDGDGVVDVAFTAYDPSDTSLLGFVSSLTGMVEPIADIDYAFGVATGDFNEDGLDDVAVVEAEGGRVAILLQQAGGGFAAPVYTADTGLRGTNILSADFNGDGKIDLAVGYTERFGAIDIMLGNGDGTFTSAPVSVLANGTIQDTIVADFDNDGVLDIAFTTSISEPGTTEGLHIALGNGDGSFGTPSDILPAGDSRSIQLIAADFNGDGVLDIAITGFNVPGTVSIFKGVGDGTFETPVQIAVSDMPLAIAAGDADLDGDLDLIVSTVLDGGVEFIINNSVLLSTDAKDIDLIPVDDSLIAGTDTASVDEDGTTSIDILANDLDADDPTYPVLASVNGEVLAAGESTTLDSGAIVTLNADGTLTYDPNGRFGALISSATAAATGAVNGSVIDSFTYELDGGVIGTVNVTVNGVTSADDQLWGGTGNDTITGTATNDLFVLSQGGDDDVNGGSGNDGFYFGSVFTAGDKVDGGAGSSDQVALQGDYVLQFGADSLRNIETLMLLASGDTSFGGDSSSPHSYDLTTMDENVASGTTLTVNGNALGPDEIFVFDGSAETDGQFFIYGGSGRDELTGGGQSDAFFFGNGRFSASDSVDGGAGSDDQVGLRGDYSGGLVFDATTMTGIETLVLMSTTDTRFAQVGPAYSYDLTLDDGNVAGGATLTIQANTLQANETARVDGSAESDGKFRFIGGAGDDIFIGGDGDDRFWGQLGADVLTGGGGNDIFAYRTTADSSALSFDTINGFAAGDKIDLSAIDAKLGTPANDKFTFIGSADFHNVAGELRATLSGGIWTIEGDVDGDGDADLAIQLTTDAGHTMAKADFIL